MLRRPRILIPVLLLAAFVVLAPLYLVLQDDPVVFLGDMHRTQHAVPLDGAETGTVQITAFHGEIALHGGTSDLLAAAFEHTYEGDAPTVTQAGGIIHVEQPARRDLILLGGYRLVEWDVRLGPVRWDVTLDAGDADVAVDVRGVTVSALAIATGEGAVTLTLPEDSAAWIMVQNGSGRLRAESLYAVDGGFVVQKGLAPGDAFPVAISTQSGDITIRVAE